MIINDVGRILIINLGGIGDVILSGPSLGALKKAYPGAAISLLVNSRGHEVAKKILREDSIFVFHIGYGGKVPLSKISANFKTLLLLRKKRFDIAINMRTIVSEKSALKLKLLFDIIAPRLRAGRDTDGRGYFFDIKVPETLTGTKSEMEYDIDIAKALGAEITERNIDFKIDDNVVQKVKSILVKNKIHDNDVLVGIHLGGTPSRRWPVECFSKVIDGISGAEAAKRKFVITGAENETSLAQKLKDMTAKEVVTLSGMLEIDELFALIKRCDLFISNDTGPMHIAAALKTRLVAICGSGDLLRFDPRNISEKAVVLHKNIKCSPCNRLTCDSLECLKAVSPEEVTEAALKFLENRD